MLFDLRDILKSLRRTPGYAATVVVTLALTIGATTAVFSIVNGVLLKPLAYRESQQLVSIREVWRQIADRIPVLEVNERHFEYWRTHAKTFESMAQYTARPANLTGGAEASQIMAASCSGSLFDVLQVRAAVGRTLNPADEPAGRPDVVVISDGLWRQRFESDPHVVGRTLILDGRPYAIVGVLPPDFRLPTARAVASVDAFVPIHMDAVRTGWVGDHNDDAIGRLREGIAPEQARAELDVLQAQAAEIATKEAHEPVTLAAIVTPLGETIVGRSRVGLLLLLGAIAAVLLIACSNLASLSLTRAVGRLRELAIRSALGASRRRLIARAVAEQLILSAAGGALGVGVAWTALRVFVRTAPVDLPRASEVALDARVLGFAALVSITAGLVVSVLPAWRTAHSDAEHALRAGATSVTSDRGALRARDALVAIQVAVSVALLVVTGLLAASFVRVMRVDRGFAADRVLLVPVAMPASRYAAPPARIAGYDRLLAAVHAIPGVQSVTTMSSRPLGGQGQVNGIVPGGSTRPVSEQPTANFRFVGPEFFRTLDMRILRGRAFAENEGRTGDVMPALISEAAAARLWPAEDAIGKRFSRGFPGEKTFEVVGVVANARITSLESTPPLMVYLPYWWSGFPFVSLLIRTASDPAALMPSVRRAVREIDPDIAIGDVRALDDVVAGALAPRRYQVQLFTAFGSAALLIAAIGVYATTAYGVSRRRREMNIRVALGARASQVVGLIVREGLTPVVAGITCGAVGALALGGVVASLLFEVRPRDPLVIASIAAIVAAVGLSACVLAARQGLVIDPASALREE